MIITTSRVTAANDLDLENRLIAINRVTKVTKGGRTLTFAAIVVVGNKDGIVDYGMGRANEASIAVARGVKAAKKNLIRVPIYNGTIPHEQTGRFGSTRILLRPAPVGSGVIAGGTVRAILDSVGVTNVLAKSQGSANPRSLVKAAIAALAELRSPLMVAQSGGIPVERVFRG